MWRAGDAMNVIQLVMEKGNGGEWFSLFPKGALTGFVSFPLQVHSTAAPLQPGDFVSGFCTFCYGFCDLHCHGEV